MACGNNHVSRAHIATQPDPGSDPQRAAEAALAEAARIYRELLQVYRREPTRDELAQAANVRARILEAKRQVQSTDLPPGTHVGKVHETDDPPWASKYDTGVDHNRTGEPKIDVYTDSDGMPRLGNLYPHVHYYEQPARGEAGATASLDHGKGDGKHAGNISFAHESAKAIADQLTILQKAIASAGEAAEVENEVNRLRDALNESRSK